MEKAIGNQISPMAIKSQHTLLGIYSVTGESSTGKRPSTIYIVHKLRYEHLLLDW